ncbi:uncharacterized protein [Ambystoma mexicanum]|uniref:uncharacterized protein n=1 Tax=Ambystoma mexicanum TaxID=8296 RepID=UPI0037E8F5F5
MCKALHEAGLTLNLEKCRFSKQKLKFFGHIFSDEGMTPDPDEVSTITDLQEPTHLAEVRSFLGMVGYCTRNIPHYAFLTKPLCRLLQKEAPFEWTMDYQTAFNYIKTALAEARRLAYFDPNWHT